MSVYKNATVDELALAASLEGIPEIEHYFEIVYKTDRDVSSRFPVSVFPAMRVLFRSPLYSIARCYIGSTKIHGVQYVAMENAYAGGHIIEYERVYPKGYGE